jgi:hypothetical protein
LWRFCVYILIIFFISFFFFHIPSKRYFPLSCKKYKNFWNGINISQFFKQTNFEIWRKFWWKQKRF